MDAIKTTEDAIASLRAARDAQLREFAEQEASLQADLEAATKAAEDQKVAAAKKAAEDQEAAAVFWKLFLKKFSCEKRCQRNSSRCSGGGSISQGSRQQGVHHSLP